MTVGYIGVGAMGGAIARRMLTQGLQVLVYDTSALAVDRMVERGAMRAGSIEEVVNTAEIVFACLPKPEVSREVALGPGGVWEGSKIKYYVENSTVGAATISEIDKVLSSKGISVLDVPVTGAVMAAEAGTLGVLVSGPVSAVEVVRPVLETFAGKILNFGLIPGQAQVAKLVNNALAFANLFGAFEALAVGVKAGIDKKVLVDLFNVGSAANFATDKILPNYILPGRFEGLGAMETGTKDLGLYLEEVERLGIQSPIAAKMAQLGAEIIAHGTPGQDTTTAYFYFCKLAGLEPK